MRKIFFWAIMAFFVLPLTYVYFAYAQPYLCGPTGLSYSDQTLCNTLCGYNATKCAVTPANDTNSTCCEVLTPTSNGTSGDCPTSGYQGFVYNPNTHYTYAVTTSTGFWTAFDNTKSTPNLAIIPDATTNQSLVSILGYYHIPKAWIGVYDNTNSTAYNSIDPQKYVTYDNEPLTYSNWAPGQPYNLLNPNDIGSVPVQGNHWAYINSSNGTWSTDGYHYNATPSYNALVQWNGPLSCVNGVTPPAPPINNEHITNAVNQYCNGTSPCYMCTNTSACTPQSECPTGYTYNSTNDDCEAAPSCPTGGSIVTAANGTVQAGSCTAPLVSVTCPQPSDAPNLYSYNATSDQCEGTPIQGCTLSGATISNGTCIVPAISSCPTGYSDSFGDGTDCEANPTPYCNVGNPGTMNGQDQCIANPTYTCPDAPTYTYDRPLSNKCAYAYTIQCPNNGHYVASANACELSATTCPDGYTKLESGLCSAPPPTVNCVGSGQYKETLGMCVEDPVATCPTTDFKVDPTTGYCLAPISQYNCPGGPQNYNSTKKMCVTQHQYSCYTGYTQVGNQCQISANNYCPAGRYDSTKKKCVTQVSSYNCPTGYTHTSGTCVASSSCPEPGSYNSDKKACATPLEPCGANSSTVAECTKGTASTGGTAYVCPFGQQQCSPVFTQPGCPNGYTYDPTTQKCIAVISCPPGGSYDPATVQCAATPGISCPGGGTYNTQDGKCEVAPGCPPGGTYNTTDNQCEAAATPTCPTGYSYNSNISKCTAAPICSQGSYNAADDKCELSVSPNCSSPYSLASAGASNYVCYASVICPTGSTYNTTRDECETAAGQPVCPSGYSYDPVSGKCQTPATCPSPGYYSYALGQCTTNYIQTCPNGTQQNKTNGLCQGSPTLGAPNCGNGSNTGTWTYIWNPTASSTEGLCQSNYNPTAAAGLYQLVLNRTPDQGGLNYWNSVFSKPPTYSNILTFVTSATYNYQHPGANGGMENPPCGYTTSDMSSCSDIDSETGSTYAEEIIAMYVWYLGRCPERNPGWGWCTGGGWEKYAGTNLAARQATFEQTAIKSGECTSTLSSGCSTPGQSGPCPKCTPSATSCPCPDNFFVSGSLTCLVQPYYDQNTNKCEFNANAECQPGTTMQHTPSGYYCVGCVTGTSYNSNDGKCEASPTNSCPPGYSPSGGACVSNAYCPSGTTLNASTGECQQTSQATPSCPSGFTYSSAYNVCKKAPTCPTMNGITGTVNTSTDRCEITQSYSCPSGMTYNSTVQKCQVSPTCPTGSVLNTTDDLCELAVTYNCPNGYTYSITNNKCNAPANCSSGTLNTTVDQCQSNPVYSCPNGYSYSSPTGGGVTGVCYGAASCPSGGSIDTKTNKCEATAQCSSGTLATQGCYQGQSCPISNGGQCVSDGKGGYVCSASPCQDVSKATQQVPTANPNDKTDNGQKDDKGNCLGAVYIFNGNTFDCRLPGIETGFSNCCANKKDWIGLGKCWQNEIMLQQKKEAKMCHYVGTYCAAKFLGICLQKDQAYCCFSGILARIIQEQGRYQGLPTYGWGKAEDPNCIGFTPDQFQALDWSKIDMSEYYAYIVTTLMPKIQQKVNTGVTNAINKIEQGYQNQ